MSPGARGESGQTREAAGWQFAGGIAKQLCSRSPRPPKAAK